MDYELMNQVVRLRSEKLIRFYESYRAAHDATPAGGRYMPFRWWQLPNPIDGTWMPYGQMLSEYATELANIINDLTNNAHRLRTWDKILDGLSDDDKAEISHEFINTLGTVALGQPYAIKSRFTFAVGHLSHQANRAKDRQAWKDDFPEKNLYLNDIEPYASKWKKYRRFKLCLEPLAGRKFKDDSSDFRNRYNHGFSSRFAIGMTEIVIRQTRNGRISYAFGGNDPLRLAEVADLLEIERENCYRAVKAFQALVEEQIAAIVAFEPDV